jgi:hypothetical protein
MISLDFFKHSDQAQQILNKKKRIYITTIQQNIAQHGAKIIKL